MEIDPVYQQHLMNQQAQQQQQQLHMVESSEGGHSDIQLSDISDDDLRRFSDGRARYAEERPLIRSNNNHLNSATDQYRHCMTTQRNSSQLQNGVTLRPVQVSTLNGVACNHHSLRYGAGNRFVNRHRMPATAVSHQGHHPAFFHHDPTHGGPLEAPITIALQGGDQFVSLQIDKDNTMYAPVHQ